MVTTTMSEREESIGGGGVRFGRQESRLLHACTHMRTRSLSSSYHQPGRRQDFRDREGQHNRHEAQGRTHAGGEKEEGRLERGESTVESSA